MNQRLGMNNPLEFVPRPTKSDLKQLLVWLKKEYEDQGEGFYCNKHIIEAGHENRLLVCGRREGKPVSFLVWSDSKRVAEVEIMATHPEHRGTGIGSALVQSAFPHLRDTKGILALHLECTPPTSEPFWRKHGFISFPPTFESHRRGIELYRPLLEELPPVAGVAAKLEIWHKPAHAVHPGEPADATWLMPLGQTNNFTRAVAILAKPDWKAQLTFPNADTRDGKVKHLFSRSSLEGGFLVGIPILAE